MLLVILKLKLKIKVLFQVSKLIFDALDHDNENETEPDLSVALQNLVKQLANFTINNQAANEEEKKIDLEKALDVRLYDGSLK